MRHAKESKEIDVKGILEKLQSCITYVKKSSKGWMLFQQACKFVGEQIKKFTTPVKTRFTSVSTQPYHSA